MLVVVGSEVFGEGILGENEKGYRNDFLDFLNWERIRGLSFLFFGF